MRKVWILAQVDAYGTGLALAAVPAAADLFDRRQPFPVIDIAHTLKACLLSTNS